MQPPAAQERTLFRTRAGLVSAAFVLALLVFHVAAVAVRAAREPHMDETEYLHAGWMMANGARLYVDFFEHHSPLFFRLLQSLSPVGTGVDVRAYFIEARWIAGMCGLSALVAFAAIVWRAAPHAAGISLAFLIGSGTLWLRAFAELRAEAFALAFFWAGAWLVTRFRGPLGGFGIGLVAFSCLWQPKWPVACVVFGVVWLLRAERRGWNIAAAAGTTAAGFGAIALIVPLDVWWFFNYDVNAVLTTTVSSSRWVLDNYFKSGKPFAYVVDVFHPLVVVPAGMLVAAGAWFERRLERILPVALLLASFIELRWVYPWPVIWEHYYAMWSIASAAVLALVPSSIAILMRRAGGRETLVNTAERALIATGAIIALVHVVGAAPLTGDRSTYWISQKWLGARLGAGDVVWLEPTRHPVSVRDAHYYWFSVGQMVGAARQMRSTERGRRYLPPTADLPACAPPPNLKYTLHPKRTMLEEPTRCMERLAASGQVQRTVFFDVWEVRLKSQANPPLSKGLE